MIALDALTERTVTIKNPINPAMVKSILMCSIPVDRLDKILRPFLNELLTSKKIFSSSKMYFFIKDNLTKTH